MMILIDLLVLFLLCLCFFMFLVLSLPICCWNLEKRKRKQKIATLLLTNPATRIGSDGFILPSVLYKKEKEMKKLDKTAPTLNIPTTPLCSPYDSTEVIIQVWDTNHQMQDMYLARTFYKIIKIWRCLKYDNTKHSINYKDAQRCVHQQTCKNILAA